MAFELEQYLSDEFERLIRDAMRLSSRNPKQRAFFRRFAASAKKAAARRHDFEQVGEHIPSFLIASITDACNLKCAGCYSQSNQSPVSSGEMTIGDWKRIFAEAGELGISAVLLAGGEPLLRRDVFETAAESKNILFPVFTNGTMFDDGALRLFDAYRNLVPIISIEGGETETDARRGSGVFKKATEAMRRLSELNVPFGVSVTVTSANLNGVTSAAFAGEVERMGAGALIFVEYVPVCQPFLALGDEERALLADAVSALRAEKPRIIVISFPGDEAKSEGCLAAGRGFFHISASGGAEPCPFSPYSDLNLKSGTIREALKSPLFTRLKQEGLLTAKHNGGCVLFEHEITVASLVK